jgi:hypothetical protein
MIRQRVTNEEMSAILRDVEADSSPTSEVDGYTKSDAEIEAIVREHEAQEARTR